MALHKLHAELASAADVIKRPHDYVAAIAAARFKTSLIETDLAANQIWNLVFDIRRAAQRRRSAQGARPQTIDHRPQAAKPAESFGKILQFPGALRHAPCAMRSAPCALQTYKEAP
jgi:hypothetical protein